MYIIFFLLIKCYRLEMYWVKLKCGVKIYSVRLIAVIHKDANKPVTANWIIWWVFFLLKVETSANMQGFSIWWPPCLSHSRFVLRTRVSWDFSCLKSLKVPTLLHSLVTLYIWAAGLEVNLHFNKQFIRFLCSEILYFCTILIVKVDMPSFCWPSVWPDAEQHLLLHVRHSVGSWYW